MGNAKELMPGYTGVKFTSIQLNEDPPKGFAALFPLFKECADFTASHDMVPQNAGNFSMRFADGIAITAAGANLDMLEKEDIIYIAHCSVSEKKLKFIGTRNPSSESLLHYLILQCRPDADAVVHVHNIPASDIPVEKIRETQREEPYGSLELAQITCDTLGTSDEPILMKNHGYVAVGSSLMGAAERIISIHLELLTKPGKEIIKDAAPL
ncbi:class II Aldolase and Adducin N-terminal domain protein [delta proteobacterium NaphS2]|nr:class II Aldolase and Adducin N-terminal domain protein [delta proteobacterium NaphS2]